MVEFSCWDFGVLECVETHPATISAVSMIVSALGVLIAAVIAYRGAKLQGQSALVAAQKQIDYQELLRLKGEKEKKISIAAIFVCEIDAIGVHTNRIIANLSIGKLPLNYISLPTQAYEANSQFFSEIYIDVSQSIFHFYRSVNSFNFLYELMMRDNGGDFYISNKSNFDDITIRRNISIIDEKRLALRSMLCSVIQDLGGEPPAVFAPDSQLTDPAPGPAVT